jgi:hypothetical protein
MTGLKEIALKHGTSAHRCICRDCAPSFAPGQPCPLCRELIEEVLQIF